MIITKPSHQSVEISKAVLEQLSWSNPLLIDLKDRYSRLDEIAVRSTAWDEQHVKNQIHLPYFRGDNAYVWQMRDGNDFESYKNTVQYLRGIDSLGLLEKLKEDGSFGVFTYEVEPGLIVSRDLLDSISEITYLNKALNLSERSRFTVLDIGSGYGRLAHRMLSAFPNLDQYLCADAVAESTFLCDFYLKHRNLENRSKVILLDHLLDCDMPTNIDLAVNIHSFSECGIDAIKFWIEYIRKLNVSYVFIVPNANHESGKVLYSSEWCGEPLPYEHLLNENGYQLIDLQPKYSGLDENTSAVSPTYYHLYKLM